MPELFFLDILHVYSGIGRMSRRERKEESCGHAHRIGLPETTSFETDALGRSCRLAGYEFQATRESCFLRDSHSLPERMRGATSMRRGMRRKTAAEVQGRPSRVR
jgi:hypothetical protein